MDKGDVANKLVANYVILGKNQKVEKGRIKTQTPYIKLPISW